MPLSPRTPRGPGVAFMIYVPEVQQVYYAEKGSNVLKVSLHGFRGGLMVACTSHAGLGAASALSPPRALHD